MWLRAHDAEDEDDRVHRRLMYGLAALTLFITLSFAGASFQLLSRADLPHEHPALWGGMALAVGAGLLAVASWIRDDRLARRQGLYGALGGVMIAMALWGWGSLQTYDALLADREPFEVVVTRALPHDEVSWQYAQCRSCVLPRHVGWVGSAAIVLRGSDDVEVPVKLLVQQGPDRSRAGTLTAVYARSCGVTRRLVDRSPFARLPSVSVLGDGKRCRVSYRLGAATR